MNTLTIGAAQSLTVGAAQAGDANHDKWIDVLSIDWGSHKPGG